MIEFSIILKVGLALLAGYGAMRLITDRNDHQKSAALMWVLQHAPQGMHARELSNLTGVSYSSIYLYLSRLEDSKIVRSTRDAQWPHRYRYHFVDEAAREAIKEMESRDV